MKHVLVAVVLEDRDWEWLIKWELECEGEVCALGALGRERGVDMSQLDPHDPEEVGEAFDVARQLAAEIVYENDEAPYAYRETPEERWSRMHEWVCSQVATEKKDSPT